MIKGIAHAALIVNDMEKTVEFYDKNFGFKKSFELADKDGNPWIIYLKIADGQFLELFYPKVSFEPKPMWKSEGFAHLCFEVEDINEIADHLKKNGIVLDVEPSRGADLNYQCWTHDPDGNAIELMQMSPDSPQLQG
ncbi:lactoylglutathione lyase [Clostridia bacterium]|nr:lactoylglutathione lyase [Clostridia bacterium]